ncbi:hypothetical protein NDU88_001905 [Pleurodeles waltl]|uniref:Uncharacterized protein n=1 Tax=Pleurodeles waltl TaxID=8319 RepID=A0AAV7NC43_PLEWA|nr:hypothetical protein NDU88_001905 [Pleurodeles waltl]
MATFTKLLTPVAKVTAEQAEVEVGTPSHIDTILEAIQSSRQALELKIRAVGDEAALLCQDHRSTTYHVTEDEIWIAALENTVKDLLKTVGKLLNSMCDLVAKLEDEGYMGRIQLQFVGVHKGAEGV